MSWQKKEKLTTKEVERLQNAALKLIDIIEKDNLGTEGLFRISGSLNNINPKMLEIKSGNMDFSNFKAPHDRAHLLKKILEELRDNGKPLLYSLDNFNNMKYDATIQNKNEAVQNFKEKINEALNKNPDANNKLIAFRLFKMLHKIDENKTKMTEETLSTTLAPNLFPGDYSGPTNKQSIEQAFQAPLEKTKTLIQWAEYIDEPEIKKIQMHLESTHYEHQTKDKGRFYHISKVSAKNLTEDSRQKFGDVKGDLLKSKILSDFKTQLEATTNENELNELVEKLAKSEEYKVLATSQGLITKILHKETSSIIAFKAMVEEQKANMKELDQGMNNVPN